jgi:hypothetical protein
LYAAYNRRYHFNLLNIEESVLQLGGTGAHRWKFFSSTYRKFPLVNDGTGFTYRLESL